LGGYLIVAGEVSGDYYAAQVAEKLKEYNPEFLCGLGGEALEKAGVSIWENPLDRSTFGVKGAVGNLFFLLALARRTARRAEGMGIKKALLVDSSGFNMYLGSLLRRRGIEVLHYIPPGVWFWGRWRAGFLARRGIKVACIFPQEADIYRDFGVETHYVGHPLAQELTPVVKKEKDLIAVLPGSRTQELKDILPVMAKAVAILKQKKPELRFILARAPGLAGELFQPAREAGIEIVEGKTREITGQAALALAASGTVTLESALLGTPLVIVYHTDRLTFWLGKRMARVDSIGLPNLVLGERFLPELLQEDFTAQKLAEAAIEILKPDRYREVLEKLSRVQSMLELEDTPGRVAELLAAGRRET